ncbi:hypothetical protein PR048_019932 [Dryococelus australis]|uniref:Uncharacterized protein n=1 Tax=Dryococelus australis TaxID=614101 RepID=A0ABQ9H4Y4_9NEOP|nr:hypothetical protein PR048_019932 [Dryococelus australis]
MNSVEVWDRWTMHLEITCNLTAVYHFRKKRHQQRRKYWVHPLMQHQFQFGAFNTLFNKLREDDAKHMNFYRMSRETFYKLLALLCDHLKHEDTNMRNCISPPEMLAVTLRLALLSRIVRVVCKKIWMILRGIYMSAPTTIMANFPNCIGAFYGKQITMIKLQDSGSMF